MPENHDPRPGARPRRQTRQQVALWEALESAGQPLSVDELLARSEQGSCSLSTVYRTVQRWLEDQKVTAVNVSGRGTFYEPAEVAAHHHHHFFCEVCEQLFDLPGCAQGLQAMLPPGYQLRSHDITLDGVCASCTAA